MLDLSRIDRRKHGDIVRLPWRRGRGGAFSVGFEDREDSSEDASDSGGEREAEGKGKQTLKTVLELATPRVPARPGAVRLQRSEAEGETVRVVEAPGGLGR